MITTRRENARKFKEYKASPTWKEMERRHPRSKPSSYLTRRAWGEWFSIRKYGWINLLGDWQYEVPLFSFVWAQIDRFQIRFPWFLDPKEEWPHALGSLDEDLMDMRN